MEETLDRVCLRVFFLTTKKTFTKHFKMSLGDVTISWNIKKGVGSE